MAETDKSARQTPLPLSGQLSEKWLIVLAFAVVYLVWGATYLFNAFAVAVIPPMLLAGCRFLTAGLLLYTFVRLRGQSHPSRKEWYNAFVLGVLFLSAGTGGVVWALQYIDSGLVALMVAIEPLLIMLLLWMLRGVRPKWGGWVGSILGITGMVILVGNPELSRHPMAWTGLIAICISLVAWGIASVMVGTLQLPRNRFLSSAMQMISGGVCLLFLSLLSGEAGSFDWAQLTLKAGLSWLWLVFFGSILAFSCFNYLLTKVSPEKVATSTYVNPVVAMVMGWAFNGESISASALLAGALMLTGVYFINSVRHSRRSTTIEIANKDQIQLEEEAGK